MSIIDVRNVTKEFKIGQMDGVGGSLKRLFGMGGGHAGLQRFNALENINFSVEAGEVVGIIGHNGAGKSTMLKVLAGVTTPTRGQVVVQGKVAPLIEVGAGLHPELTGRENVSLNASILGVSRSLIKELEGPILEFAELERFADTPIKKYSSGMKIRLGFAIAAHVEADIIIVDEVLSVGDLAFQRKCFDRMESLIVKQNKTVLFVSHNIRQVKRLCSRTILLAQGNVVMDGDTNKVCDYFYETSDDKISAQARLGMDSNIIDSDSFKFISMEIRNENDESVNTIQMNSKVDVVVRYKALEEIEEPKFIVGIHTTDFIYVSTFHNRGFCDADIIQAGEHEMRCTITSLNLSPGVYSLRLGVDVGKIEKNVFYGENLLHFKVVGDERYRSEFGNEGIMALGVDWHQVM